jgi:hypothetical protein
VVKTFVLDGRTPTGMMIFSAAEFGGCPWSTVVDHMRSAGLGGEATLADTVASFMARLNALCDSDMVEAGDGVMTFRIFAVQAVADFWRTVDKITDAHPSMTPEAVLVEALSQLEHEVGSPMSSASVSGPRRRGSRRSSTTTLTTSSVWPWTPSSRGRSSGQTSGCGWRRRCGPA